MIQIKKVGLFCLIISLCLTSLAFAEKTIPLQLSVWEPIQLVNSQNSIAGLRFNLLYTDNLDMSGLTLSAGWAKTSRNMSGIALGPVNWTNGLVYGFNAGILNYGGSRRVGLDVGMVNIAKGNATGAQLGITNWDFGYFHGAQIGVVNYTGENFVGLGLGAVNITKGDFSGFEAGIVNYVRGTTVGFQLGIFNYAKNMSGLQIGLFNGADNLQGLQTGISNYNGNEDPMIWMALANWSF
jgi:uncharacterized protein YjbI with pentapeptide repeats